MLLVYCYVLLSVMVPITYAKQNPCQTSEHCSCSIVNWVYKYDCKLNSSDHHVQVYVHSLDTVIHCHGNPTFESSYLPHVNYAYKAHTLKIYECSIPNDGFGEVLRTIKSEHLKTLFFERRAFNKTFTGADFEGLADLEDLVLHDNRITTWQKNTTVYLPKLKILSLDFNSLELYDNMFENATTVTYLSIQNNSLTYLPKKVFKGLKNVDRLHLENNQIGNLDHEIIEDLVNLQYLIIYNNRLKTLDENIFKGFPQLLWIFLNGNRLTNVTRKLYSYCEPEVLKLNNNLNLNVTDDVFSDFFTLIWAESMNIGLENLSENFYSNSVSLEYINLRKNKLKTIPTNVFKGLEHLKTLDLGQNKIIEVNSEMFVSLKNLIILYLDHNFLTTISDDIFPKSSQLNRVELSDNEIYLFETNVTSGKDRWLEQNDSEISTMRSIYVDLKYFNLNNNKLVGFPRNSLIIAAAQNLLLSNNNIISLNTSYFHYFGKKAQTVNLDHNNISTIYFEKLETNYSESLDDPNINVQISDNPINCDCNALDLVKYVNEKNHTVTKGLEFKYDNLSCSGPSNLRDMPLTEVPLKDLTCRLLRGCTENNVCACSYRPSDETLLIDCSTRNISKMPVLELSETYNRYAEINGIEVHLEDNFLTQIQEEVDGYEKVTELYLHNNFIGNISWIPPSIKVLDLGNNSLTSLNLEILKQLTENKIQEINFSNNPWNCSCDNLEFSHLLKNRSLRVIDINNIRCDGYGNSLISLNDEDICPVEINLIYIVLPVCLIFSLITIILILLCYIYSEFILAWLYSKGFCLWLIKEERIDKSKKYDAFISFASQDENFVNTKLVPELERGTPSYKLCVHSRDWMPGLFINTQITDSVRYSRRTLVILSKYFLESVWGRMEFRTAHTEAIREGRVRVIVIVYGDVDLEALDDEMKTYIGTNTYIKWGDPWFWEKLKYALPRRHKPNSSTWENKPDLPGNKSIPRNDFLEMSSVTDRSR